MNATSSFSLVEYGYRRTVITITAVFCALLEIIDTTIVNVAINDMRGNLGATLSEISWVITAYSLGNVIIVPMTSWLSQQFGRRNYFAASVIVFTVCSFLCGNATSIWELVIFRFIQGLGGGALLVTSQTIITESWPVEKRAMAQAIYTIGIIMGPTLGPTLGGYIVDNYSWPYIFYINIPVGIVATILTLSYIRSPKYEEKRPSSQVDWLGIALLTIGISSLQYVLEKGQEEDWYNSKIIIFFTGTATLGMLTFIWRELSYAYPIVNLRVLKNSNLRIGVMLSFVLGFGLYGASFILPLFTQSLLGWTAMQAGMLQLPTTIFVMFMLPLVGKLIQSGVPQKYLIAIGLMIFFIYSMYASSLLTLETSSGNLFWILMVRGLGLSLLSVPVSTMALSTLKGQEIGQGAAFSGMMRQLGGSFGVALISTFVYRQTQVHRNVLITHLPAYDPDVQQRLAQLAAKVQHESGLDSLTSRQTAYAMLDRSVNTQATLLSYTDVFLWIGLMFLIFVPIVLVFVAKGKNKISLADAAH